MSNLRNESISLENQVKSMPYSFITFFEKSHDMVEDSKTPPPPPNAWPLPLMDVETTFMELIRYRAIETLNWYLLMKDMKNLGDGVLFMCNKDGYIEPCLKGK